jgi:transposase InsO family protein
MVNHYQQFIKNMRFVRKPLDDLLKKDTKWEWNTKCEQAFQKIKEILSSDLLLTHYDPSLEIVVAADASESGIGAVISHKFPDGSVKAIAHASSSLAPAEKNYSQIEKEGLALIFAVQKFHKMIYGRHFILQTDHKPLLSIFGSKKGVKQCSANRLLRWSLILLAYDFTIEYVNTLDFGQADALSRLIAKGDKGENERVIASLGTELELNSILTDAVQSLPIKFNDILRATEQDNIIGKIKSFVQQGWPDQKKMEAMDEKIKLFHHRKSDLSIVSGCLMFADRIVIPEIYHKKVLQTLHKGHPGIKRMKQLARKYIYWPKVDMDIENLVKGCEPCQMEAKAPVKTNLHSWPKATGPWQRVHMDYAGPFFGKEFLIIVDAHSKYPEVFEMTTKSTTATIAKLRYLSTRHGIPDTLVTDNGTQFTSNEFNKFTEINGIKHYFSAPYNPMSNGQAERFVDIFKRTFRKLKGEGTPSKESIDTLLVTYRTTPNDSLPNGKCPAEVFLGRKPKTTLDLLRPPQVQPMERNEEMEKNFNRRFGTKMRVFHLGDKVFARHRSSQSWKTGIISKCTGVIYDVRFADTSVGRFHANQLRSRQTENWVEDPLAIFNEAFNLPQPPVAEENMEGNEMVPLEINEGPQQGNGNGNEVGQNNGNPGPIKRNPPRVRRPPNKYSPPR